MAMISRSSALPTLAAGIALTQVIQSVRSRFPKLPPLGGRLTSSMATSVRVKRVGRQELRGAGKLFASKSGEKKKP